MLKLVIILLLFGVLASLFSGLFFLYRDRGAGHRTVKALTVRVALSVTLFVLLLVAYWLGLLPPRV
ncbi:twin transmembrane helix small protein [Propionivibrio soli]|jgi:hypothetical protein|uniref:twin transmembrane helix small protein n=1 Tax=Propionivibrio soli TaxID=2976531 RepID=UPI0021E6DB1B|nr:twin transmembrane helix small protein [Propionivibrio soli]